MNSFTQKLETAIRFARISRVARLTRMDYLGLPVYQCTRPFSRNLVSSQGKAFTSENARIAAIMESMESFHGETVPIDEEASLTQMEKKLGYDLLTIHSSIPKNKKIRWTKAFDLIQKKESFLPHALICLDFTEDYQPDLPIMPTSNGYAAGSSIEGALQHGILEILERHISATCKPDYVPLNEEIDFLLQPFFTKLRERHFKMGIFYYPNSVSLPMFKVNIQEPGKTHTYFGMACHPNKATALKKAFSEALQSRVSIISGARDDIEHQHYQSGNQKKDLLFNLQQFSTIPETESYSSLNEKEKVDFLVEKIKCLGHQNLLMVDLTKKEIEIPVVVVVAPGFEFSLHQGGFVK